MTSTSSMSATSPVLPFALEPLPFPAVLAVRLPMVADLLYTRRFFAGGGLSEGA